MVNDLRFIQLPLHELEENLAELLDQESVNIRMVRNRYLPNRTIVDFTYLLQNGRLYESTKYYGTAELFPLLMLPTARDKVGAGK